jgi:hypothetical protein
MFLDDDEIDAMCAGVSLNAVKAKRLAAMGLIVNRKPNGRPLVVRAHAEAVLSGRPETTVAVHEAPTPFQPDRDAFILKFRRKTA